MSLVVSNARNACVALVVGGLCALGAVAQTNRPTEPLQLSGLLGASVSTEQDNGKNTAGKEVGVTANLSGYWRHPAILSFSVSPRGSLGREAVPIEGNEYGGNGIGASANLLGKSRFPLSISYNKSWMSSPLLETSDPTQHINELSGTQDSLNITFAAALRRLGNYTVGYTTSNDSAETLLDTGIGDTAQHIRNFNVTGERKLLTLSLNADYSSQETTATVPGSSNDNRDTSYGVNAFTNLPLHGSYSMTYRHTRSEYIAGESVGANDGDLLIANVSFTPVSRLTTYVRGTYNTGSVTGQLMETGRSITLAGLTSTQQRSGNAGASVRLGWGATVFGDVQEQVQTIVQTGFSLGATSPSLQWRSGVNWGRQALGGDVSLSYTHSEDAFDVGSQAQEVTHVQSAINAANGRYRRVIAGEIELTAGGSVSRTSSEGKSLNSSSGNSWYVTGAHQFRHWKVTARWNSSLSDSWFFNTNTHSRSNMVIVTLASSRLSMTVSHVLSGNTGYRFGNQFIRLDNAVVASLLPEIRDADSMSDSVALNYRLGRKMRVTGRWVRAQSDTVGIASFNSGYDARWEYWFRLLRWRAGYMRTSIDAGQIGRADTRIYFTVLRPFKVW